MRFGGFLLLQLCVYVSVNSVSFDVKYAWKNIDYKWPNSSARAAEVKNGGYIKENIIINGIRVWKDRIFITTPRLKRGVPATISTIPNNFDGKSPPLEPFPNWNRQKLGSCQSFTFVQAIEIDTEDRLWLLDTGRVQTNYNETVKSKCPPRLVIIDLKKIDFDGLNPGKDYIVRSYTFDSDVAAPTENYLSDLVVDNSDGWFAYMTDTGKNEPGLVVYSFKQNKAWKVKNSKSMTGTIGSEKIDGENLDMSGGKIDSLALSPVADKRTLYFSDLASFTLHSIGTKHLKNPEKDIGSKIKDLGEKISLSQGMVMDNKNNLYFGLLTMNAIGVWNTKKGSLKDNQEVIAKNNKTLCWPGKLAVYRDYLYIISNNMQSFFLDMDFKKVNFRILTAKINAKSYMFGEN